MYNNLIAKTEEKKISKRDIQKLLDIHYNSVSNKFSHKTCFTIDEAIKIQECFSLNASLVSCLNEYYS